MKKEENTPNLTDTIEDGIMSIGELWKYLNKFVMARCEDNELYNGKYPIEVRKSQMQDLKVIVETIEQFHKKYS